MTANTHTLSLWRVQDGLRYGFLGFPLAFCALPLYVLLPNLYAREFGVGLSTLGGILLGARLFDAMIDPLLGRWCDRLYRRSLDSVQRFGAVAALLLAIGFAMLFFPLTRQAQALQVWAAAWLVFTYAAFSALSVAHQSWGAMLGGDESVRSRIVAWREGLGLVGVVIAALLPSLLGLGSMVALFALSLLVGLMAWRGAVRPLQPLPQLLPMGKTHNEDTKDLWLPWRVAAFRKLILVFSINGIASAVPATLVLFFVQDRLQASESIQPLFLGSYFVFAALSMPLWLVAVKRFGLQKSWLAGMGLAIAVFLSALQMGPGDVVPFILVCALSGVALGSDLALPGAMLAGVIGQANHRGVAEGAYFGWWNFASKLNLALAAGVTLPLLQWFGYTPGARDVNALEALGWTYCLLPCVLKAMAALALYIFIIKPETEKEAQ